MARSLGNALLVLAMLTRCGSTPATPTTTATNTATAAPPASPIVRILSDPALFGPDIGAVLRLLPAFAAAGEARVMVFRDRAVGTNAYRTPDEAKRTAGTIRDRGERVMSPTLPLPPPRISLKTIDATPWLDDRAWHVVAQAPGAQLLADGLRLETVQQRLGPWERHEELVIDDGTERHPTVLELYWYAGGAIAFATRENTVDPHVVERVYLDTQRVSAAIF
jgi:hypothetical protein